MADRRLLLDATVFLGMHHGDGALRERSLRFFAQHFEGSVAMNYEQVGICDAVIWRQDRLTQDLYYPFMDRLHSDMQIVRAGYTFAELAAALRRPELRALRVEQAMLVAQAISQDAQLATHDPALRGLAALRDHLWTFEAAAPEPRFPAELQGLYEVSRAFVYDGQEAPR